MHLILAYLPVKFKDVFSNKTTMAADIFHPFFFVKAGLTYSGAHAILYSKLHHMHHGFIIRNYKIYFKTYSSFFLVPKYNAYIHF